MKVGLYNDSFSPQVDGVAVTVANYSKIINRDYDSAYVVVPKMKKRNAKDFDFPVLEYPSTKITLAGQYNLGLPVSYKLDKMLMDIETDLIHSHCPFTSGLYASYMADKKKVPHVTTFHSKFKDDVNSRHMFKTDLPGEIVAKQIVEFYKYCDHVWAVNKGTANTLIEYGHKGDITVMPNGCDMEVSFADPAKKKALMEKYGFTSNAPLLLFVGRLTFTKNLDVVVKALGALNRCGVDFNMLFVGNGEDQQTMEDMAKDEMIVDKVKFAGKILDRAILRDIYTCADLFLFPSVYDNAPLVVREAAACGTPSIMIAGSNSAEDSIDGLDAFLCKNTVEDFTLTLANALQNADLIKVGEMARKNIYRTWDSVLEKVMQE